MPVEKIENPKTLKSIQILRVIAALSVVYDHCTVAGDYKLPVAGNFGVDIFFVISGFIISYMVSKNTEYFFIKRILRVMPLYMLATIAMTLTVILFPHLVNRTTVSLSGFIKSALFIPGPENRGLPILAQGWTLNFEIFFYASMALCAGLVKNKKYAAILCAGMLTAFIITAHIFTINNYIVNKYKNGLFPEFIYGIILYYLYRRKPGNDSISAVKVILLATLAVISYAYMVCSKITGFHIASNRNIYYGLSAVTLTGAVLFLEAAIKENRLVKFLVKLGEASYVMYLFHYHSVLFFSRIVFPKIFGTGNRNTAFELLKLTLAISFTVLVSLLLYELLDKRIQQYVRNFLKKKDS
jgi:peptidoglycan/LPS O-acetylase OafA/YrhL